ncbi:hypothetical protein FBU30_000352 [Linnemannia zychae]|nr:hypothetical protein FBU30_000352 [Linnemannia zychae]
MSPQSDFTVIIAGAGLAGLTLAVLLERAKINYQLFERATAVRPLGTALSIGPSVLPMIEQLGLMDQFKALAKENDIVSNYNEDMELTSTVVYTEFPERTGYPNYCIARPCLYDLLYSQIPSEKVHMNKRFESLHQTDTSVTVKFSDKTTIQGTILVGADGAYSAVRKTLYSQLDQQDKLPVDDKEELPCSSICLVGQTRKGLSREKFPYLKERLCRFENVTGKDKPYTWLTFCMPDDSICWMVIEHLYMETNRAEIAANNVEWGSGSADVMIEKVRGFPIPSGGNSATSVQLTLSDLIDETPREYISQVALEGKFFETWYAGRTVLIGDACHKVHRLKNSMTRVVLCIGSQAIDFLTIMILGYSSFSSQPQMYPSAAQGANVAIQDAIVLCNYLYAMQLGPINSKTITHAFEQYRLERYASARQAYDTSERFRQLFRKRWINGVIRFMIKYIPQMIWNKVFDKVYSNRPQVAFLPLVKDRGSVKAFPQKSLHIQMEQEE